MKRRTDAANTTPASTHGDQTSADRRSFGAALATPNHSLTDADQGTALLTTAERSTRLYTDEATDGGPGSAKLHSTRSGFAATSTRATAHRAAASVTRGMQQLKKAFSKGDRRAGAVEPRVVIPFQPNPFCDNEVVNSRYTLLTFLPLNLYEQFRRPLNMYFLLVACLQFITVIAPVNPLSTLLPLLFAFTLTAVKEGYDDVKRHRADNAYNSRTFRVLNAVTGEIETRESWQVRVGDVIELKQDDEIPCDAVCIAAPEHNRGIVFIRTDNLDGEIDLKPRDVLPRAALNIETATTAQIAELARRCKFTCPAPNEKIEGFDATAVVPTSDGESTVSIGHQHLLLQSAYVKNTARMFAVVIYTGNETKCGMNKAPPPVKWAKLDRSVSKYSMIIFATQIVTALSLGTWGYAHNMDIKDSAWYLGLFYSDSTALDVSGWAVVIFPLRFFLLTSVMIPISFKFVVDMSKYYMALVLEWDLDMWDDERDEGMRVKNSGIVEDLAQIEYILSDKTGTLTQNVMKLKALSVDGDVHVVGGEPLGDEEDRGIATQNSSTFSRASRAASVGPARASKTIATAGTELLQRIPATEDCLVALSLCNTVEVNATGAAKPYSAVSPDEEALCEGCAAAGVALVERTRDQAIVSIYGRRVAYRVLSVFAFSSERRCMSILLEREAADDERQDEDASNAIADARFVLLTKGADDKILSMLTPEQRAGRPATELVKHVDRFASRGLRTLVVGKRVLTEAQVKRFLSDQDDVMKLLEGRQVALEALQMSLEKDMSLVGSTAVEDKLQEDLQHCIGQFLAANVGFWMLTGDKVETAQQIAVSCGLLPASVSSRPATAGGADPTYIRVCGSNWEDTLKSFRVSPEMLEQREKMRRRRQAAKDEGLFTAAKSMFGENFPLTRSQGSTRSSYGGSEEAEEPSLAATRVVGQPGMNMLVQGGAVLDAILADPVLSKHFMSIAMVCKAVVCARVTPAQKAAVCALVNAEAATTLCIGDGGNDVAMIQEAHVGVGIIGKEGQQAARAADFAITQFRFLPVLMFVHGHMSYARTCYVVQYSFYKSMLISFIQIAYNIAFGGMSGVSFWNSFFLTMWNGAFTLPQTLFYTLDRVVPRGVLLHRPELYRLSQKGYHLTMKSFFAFVFRGIFQSVGVLLLLSWFYGGRYAAPGTGFAESNDVMFTVGYTTLIFHQVFTVLLESNAVTLLNAIAIFLMPLAYMATTVAYSSIPRFAYYGVFKQSMGKEHWAFVAVGVAILFFPHFALRALQVTLWPNPAEACRHEALKFQRGAADARPGWRGALRQWFTTPQDEIELQMRDVLAESRPASSLAAGVGRSANYNA